MASPGDTIPLARVWCGIPAQGDHNSKTNTTGVAGLVLQAVHQAPSEPGVARGGRALS
jgi:hypothetical protein